MPQALASSTVLAAPRVCAPVLTGVPGDQARSILSHLAQRLRRESGACTQGILGNGLPGMALALGYLALADPSGPWQGATEEALGAASEVLAASSYPPWLGSGFTGLAWVIDHLQARVFQDSQDFNVAVDAALLAHLETPPEPVAFDLLSGLVGLGLYGWERLHRGSARSIVLGVLDHLERLAVPSIHGHAWWSAPPLIPSWQRAEHPEGHADLGVAHGIPGVVAFLARVHRAGLEPARTRWLAEGAISWLQAHRNPPGAPTRFARTLTPDGRLEPTHSKVNWCYGDLGVSRALLAAGSTFQREDWELEAMSLALGASRHTVEAVHIPEAGLCHGAAGAAHQFLRWYLATGDPRFGQASRIWYEETLTFWNGAMFRPDRDCDEAPEGSPWTPGSFLLGDSGIALSLIAGLGLVHPDWDRLLLLDI